MFGGRNIAVIGCGYWGKNLVRNFAQLGVLHTICDVELNVLAHLAPSYPGINIESEYLTVVQNGEIKGVVIATPATLHYSMAKEALLAGKDVFVEKPLALNAREGKELVELAEEKDKILMVGHLIEYHPAVVKLKELVNRGEIGEIQYIYSHRLNFGKFRTEENVLWSFAPHDISVILLLLNEMPQDISTYGGCYLHQDIVGVAMTTMSFKNGVKAHIFVNWFHPYKERRLVIAGDRKLAEFNDVNPEDKLFLYSYEIEWIKGKPNPCLKEAEAIRVSLEEPLKLECQDFIECIQTRGQPRVDGHKGLQVLEVLACCQKSLEENGKVIHLNEEFAR